MSNPDVGLTLEHYAKLYRCLACEYLKYPTSGPAYCAWEERVDINCHYQPKIDTMRWANEAEG
jgi:hypothetical protein